jgi:hypothetical protein
MLDTEHRLLKNKMLRLLSVRHGLTKNWYVGIPVVGSL